MQRLRDPDTGCPWDLEQNYKTIVPSTIEEAYEVVDAIERNDLSALKEELGDYLFQAVFYCQLASEERLFDLNSVIDGLVAKLVRRHPHVFPAGTLAKNSEINRRWEELKQEERSAKGLQGVFDDVPKTLPSLLYAHKTQKRAARQKFDWSSVEPVYGKLQEEIEELQDACQTENREQIEEELGDLLFTCVNLSRHLKVDAETALRRSTEKFKSRYHVMQKLASDQYPNHQFEELSEAQMEGLWQMAKRNLVQADN
ncbi:UNVERIFIED_CONTAM: hypothetical protein GTU68_035820 [Idotea baltica]|nr:hypothetical protein [Idotea baltica]